MPPAGVAAPDVETPDTQDSPWDWLPPFSLSALGKSGRVWFSRQSLPWWCLAAGAAAAIALLAFLAAKLFH
jgi:hypothetical protein